MAGNESKREAYAENKIKLKKAICSGFWLEAVFIEYAIFEDRAESILEHAETIKLVNKQGKPLKLEEKLNKIKSCKPFTEKEFRKYLTPELVEEIRGWKNKRNKYVHDLLNMKIDEDEIRCLAVEGQELIKKFDNKVKSVNRILDNRKMAENNREV